MSVVYLLYDLRGDLLRLLLRRLGDLLLDLDLDLLLLARSLLSDLESHENCFL